MTNDERNAKAGIPGPLLDEPGRGAGVGARTFLSGATSERSARSNFRAFLSRKDVAADRNVRAPSSRPELARQRSLEARDSLANCHLCAHHCGVNRLAGEQGLCRAGAEARFFHA